MAPAHPRHPTLIADLPTPPTGVPAVLAPPPDPDAEFRRAWARDLAAPSTAGPRPRRPVRILLPRVLRRRSLLASGVVALAVLAALAGALHLMTERLGEQVRRVPDVFDRLGPGARPAPGRSTTFLLVGTDSRVTDPTRDAADPPAGLDDAQQGDLVMIARLNADRTVAAVASIPRDADVDIPGHGHDTLDAAYAYGGPSLLITSVENLTALRIDHFAVIDFAGFRSMVDAVGGIDVDAEHLDGPAALAYLRQRPGLAGHDRAQRELGVLRALLLRVVEQRILASPTGTYSLLDAATRAVSVDDTLDNAALRGLTSTLHDLEPTDITFVRAPVAGFGDRGGGAAVPLDGIRSAGLWAALRDDRVAAWADAHPADALQGGTR